MSKYNKQGLFTVEQIQIEDYDEEGNLTGEPELWYSVTSKLNGVLGETYPCRNEETAKELCEHLNLLTTDFMFESRLPAPLELHEDTPTYKLGEMINMKSEKLEDLKNSMNNELACELDYLHKSNDLKLKPKLIQEELELTKLPTEKQVNAYIENKLSFELDMWKAAKANTSLIRQQLDLINDRISFERYSIRLRLKE